MSFNRHITLAGLLVCLLVCISACSSTAIQDTYYSLAPGQVANATAPVANTREMRLTLARITLPQFLQKQNLVMQKGAHTLVHAKHHFWAEPLEDGIAKVLVQGIIKNSNALQVEINAGRWSADSDCSLRLEFDSFHATQSGQVISAGRFWLQGAKSDSPNIQQFNYSDDLWVDGYAQVVTQLHSSAQKLSSTIVKAIEETGVCAANQAS